MQINFDPYVQIYSIIIITDVVTMENRKTQKKAPKLVTQHISDGRTNIFTLN